VARQSWYGSASLQVGRHLVCRYERQASLSFSQSLLTYALSRKRHSRVSGAFLSLSGDSRVTNRAASSSSSDTSYQVTFSVSNFGLQSGAFTECRNAKVTADFLGVYLQIDGSRPPTLRLHALIGLSFTSTTPLYAVTYLSSPQLGFDSLLSFRSYTARHLIFHCDQPTASQSAFTLTMADPHRDPYLPDSFQTPNAMARDTEVPRRAFYPTLPPLPQTSHYLFTNSSAQSVMDGTAPTPPSAPAPAPAPAPMMGSVARFISKHTVYDNDLAPTDECPICLDSYTDEKCLRSIDIAGCSHHIGSNCLEGILRTSPREEKRCPLCRAVWIPVRTRNGTHDGPMQIYGLHMPLREDRMIGVPTTRDTVARMRAAQDMAASMMQAQRSRPGQASDFRTPVPAPSRPLPSSNPIVIDSDSDSVDYETQVRNFQDFARDVANIRDRAQNTRRRRPRHQSVNNITPGDRDTGNKKDNKNFLARSNTSAGGNGNGALNRIMNTGRHFNPFRPPTNDANQSATATESPGIPIPRERPLNLNHERTPLPPRTRENSPTAYPSSPTLPSIPSINLDVDMYDGEFETLPSIFPVVQTPRRSEDVNVRQQNVNRYREVLNIRQAALRRREAAMEARVEHGALEGREALNRRNAAGLERERDAQLVITVMQRHRAELDDLLTRQREELDRLIISHRP